MSISDRKAAALRRARRAPPQQLRTFVTHFINTRAFGPQGLESSAHPFVRRGWCHPSGRLTADGAIVGRAFMAGEIE
jgi:hypothetical protein